MKISEKIEGFADMTAEEKLKAIEEFEFSDGSDEIAKLKASVSKANSEASEWKKKHNALLSDEEKKTQMANEEFETLKAENEQLKREKTVADYRSKYLSLGYDDTTATESANALVDGNTEKLFEIQKKNLDVFKQNILSEGLKMPKPETGGHIDKPTITKEQFNKMSMSERTKLYQTDKATYDALNK